MQQETLTLVIFETKKVRCMQQSSTHGQARDETGSDARGQSGGHEGGVGHGHGRAVGSV